MHLLKFSTICALISSAKSLICSLFKGENLDSDDTDADPTFRVEDLGYSEEQNESEAEYPLSLLKIIFLRASMTS